MMLIRQVKQREKMALDMKLLCGLSLILILEFKGSNAQGNVCGKAPEKIKIVGGHDATPASWPWQASIHSSNGHFCGGSLINKEWVLTAAHCFPNSNTMPTVYLGRQSQEGSNPNEVRRQVTQITCHPDYNKAAKFDSDICLLKLDSPVTFTDSISPVCLAASQSTFHNGTSSWVTGWGAIDIGVPLPSPQTLQEVEVPVMGNKQCGCYLDQKFVITDKMICAGLQTGGKDSCQGDSGGPMVYYNGGRWIQSGVVSFGEGCALPYLPGVYTRVSRFQQWISDRTTDQIGFLGVQAPGHDNDDNVCPKPPIPTKPAPNTAEPGYTGEPLYTAEPGYTGEPLYTAEPPFTNHTGPTTSPSTSPEVEVLCDGKDDHGGEESLFCGGPHVTNFSYFAVFLTVVLVLFTLA